MPTTIDSMTGVEIKSPFFDTAVSLELFPVHPNVLKNPNAPQKNRVALIYGSNGSGKSTIAQGFREYSESVVPKTVELNPTAGAAIIKMSSGMKSGKIFVFDEKYISRNIKVQESGLGTIVLLGEQVELEKRLEELKAQIAKLQANIDSKAENVEKFNLVSDVISPEYWKAAITKKLQSSGGWAETSGIRIKRNQIKTRVKLNQMLSACATTKVLMMSHDVSVIFDLQKVMDEVSANCAEVGKHAEYCSFQLVNKRIVPFKAKSHNEYTRLMKCVYEYGRNPEPTAELTIGNMTRRVLEAFSTFTFKEGPDKVSLNPQVLALIPDQNKRAYFQNSMYRLVLNTESHLQEAVQGAPEMSFFSHLTVEEKQRTARDVLCFMYCVNPAHVLAHLPNARKELDNWMASIG